MGGRITREDVLQHLESHPSAAAPASGDAAYQDEEHLPLTPVRG